MDIKQQILHHYRVDGLSIREISRKNPRDTGVVSYYDLEKDAWRCFKADSIQEIDQEYGRC